MFSSRTVRSLLFGFLALGASGSSAQAGGANGSGAQQACQELKDHFAELVSFSDSDSYAKDIAHWAASSVQNSTCSVEPSSEEDVAAIIKIIAEHRAPFGIKSGGHGYDPRSSSTPGVQISLSRFRNISYDADHSTITIGTGLTWYEIFVGIEQYGVMIPGARVNTVGAGYCLGGGYSYKASQYGLFIDNVVSYDLVLPTGECVHVTEESNPDLFFGLKGGMNNFGIVTAITVEAHPQTEVYGGMLTYAPDQIEQVKSAIANFSQNNTDPKAELIAPINSIGGLLVTQVHIFYDAPAAPPGIFDEFLAIPTASANVSTRSFVDFMMATDQGDLGIGPYGAAFHTIPVTHYTKGLMDEMLSQAQSLSDLLLAEANGSIVVVTFTPETFVNHFSHSRGGAYPHDPNRSLAPTETLILYQENLADSFDTRYARYQKYAAAVKNLSLAIQAKAVEEGVSRWDDILYPNYALLDTPLELMYGENVPRLQALAAQYDPDKVMTLTGGKRFQN